MESSELGAARGMTALAVEPTKICALAVIKPTGKNPLLPMIWKAVALAVDSYTTMTGTPRRIMSPVAVAPFQKIGIAPTDETFSVELPVAVLTG